MSGGSGSYSYSWSNSITGQTGMLVGNVGFSGSGTSYTVQDAISRTCPTANNASAYGTASVTVTDTVSGLQTTVTDDWYLEYTA